jgi:tetratricopeptide (TPR) repeat protein
MGLAKLRLVRRRVAAGVALAVALAVVAGAFGWPRLRRPPGGDVAFAQEALDPARATSAEVPPVHEWSDRFQAHQAKADWDALDADLRAIEAREHDLYAFYRLGYLHGRTALARGEPDEARDRLQPFLAADHPLRDLALYHAARAEEADGDQEAAAQLRWELISGFPQANYRQPAIEAHLEWLGERKDVEGLRALGEAVSGDAALTRAVEARIVEAIVETDRAGAVERGLKLLRANAGDDAAERVTRVLDRPDIVDALPPEDWVLIGESARSHRHYDRAVALLEKALPQRPTQRAELLFAIGRAHFHAERSATRSTTPRGRRS